MTVKNLIQALKEYDENLEVTMDRPNQEMAPVVKSVFDDDDKQGRFIRLSELE